MRRKRTHFFSCLLSISLLGTPSASASMLRMVDFTNLQGAHSVGEICDQGSMHHSMAKHENKSGTQHTHCCDDNHNSCMNGCNCCLAMVTVPEVANIDLQDSQTPTPTMDFSTHYDIPDSQRLLRPPIDNS